MSTLATRLMEPGDNNWSAAKSTQSCSTTFLGLECSRGVFACRHLVSGSSNRAGAAGDHVDSPILELIPQAFSKHPSEGLAGRVGRKPRRTLVAREGGHEDDSSPATTGISRQ